MRKQLPPELVDYGIKYIHLEALLLVTELVELVTTASKPELDSFIPKVFTIS